MPKTTLNEVRTASESETTLDEARTAYELVRKTAEALRVQHAQVVDALTAVEGKLKSLPLDYLPLEDLKAGIADFIEASGQRYGQQTLRELIASFATGGQRSLENVDLVSQLGKPLRYCDLEDAISNADGKSGRAQLLTSWRNGFNDQLLYFLFADILRDKLREVMDAMPAADFGYTRITPDKIGSPRPERRQAITNLRIDRKSVV